VSQTKRSHVLARTRWREQAARLVARFLPGARLDGDRWVVPCGYCGGHGMVNGYSNDVQDCPAECFQGMTEASVVVLHGGKFDVALVRAHCERLIAEAERRAADRVVFEDWTRDRGLGPDNREPAAFGLSKCCGLKGLVHVCDKGRWCDCGDPRHREADPACETCSGTGFTPRGEFYDGPCPDCRGLPPDFYRPGCLTCKGASLGGWPGRLAREYGWERCDQCFGTGRGGGAFVVSARASDAEWRQRIRCSVCKGRGRVRRHGITPGFAAVPGIARTAQRLLDTLEGRCPWAADAVAQVSGCRSCGAVGFDESDYTVADDGRLVRPECSDCRGTGHNLAGVLPPVEERQKALAFEARLGRDVADGHRVGQAARGDGFDCTHCQGRGLSPHGLCRFCDGAGRMRESQNAGRTRSIPS
jgi:hypothetical protein